ncbi:Arabinanase/levansucrase/invertase [Sodiomyces alkalinus F11]|uniref:Arabinanase/levansucrase/invertase n=1 Tax=Sodiomyces alkalinus (strain CBS 110278 / VKM F-3762 / F11) TaxID=1314773 RepID=A0A3N2PSY3_SODAK|nr:Arabinanase/levansucrase/invertase [Sodiomyces alkalinus F11]ROT37600.1 Arabinanase/levansucrase/invertase [Sodiomyces alkalinus F11]
MVSPHRALSSPNLLFLLALTVLEVTAASVEDALAALRVTNVHAVRGNLHLPESSEGFAVTWQSSDPHIISADGIVTRQPSINAQLDPFEGYAFSYFTESSLRGENIFFAASVGNDALDWQELNGGEPVLRSEHGTRGLRDPFLIRSPEGDTFYLIATDLSIGSGTSWGDAVRRGSHYLEVWESHDLVNWSEQRHVLVSPSNAGNTWAPEAFYVPELGSYAVFWASSLYDQENDPNHDGASYHRMLYSLTRDFVTFGEPQIWQDAGDSRIDTTVLEADGTLYRFTKDEGAATGCTDIIQEQAGFLLDPLDAWAVQGSCIGAEAGTSAVEGPTAFRANPGDVHGDKFYLFVDEYGGRGYIPLETDDIGSPDWKVSSSYNLPRSPRHGTVIPVTAAEHAALVEALNSRKSRFRRSAKTWA